MVLVLVLVLVSVFFYGTATTYHPCWYQCFFTVLLPLTTPTTATTTPIGSGCGTCTLASAATASTTNATTIATFNFCLVFTWCFSNVDLLTVSIHSLRFVACHLRSHVQEREQKALPALFSACRWLLRSMVLAPAPRTLCFYHVSW